MPARRASSGEWVSVDDAKDLEPGDTIWVPERQDRDYWQFFKDVLTVTTQIVTIDTPNGEIKARTGSEVLVKAGENVGLEFNGATLTVFDANTGLALRSAGNERVLGHG